MPYVKGDPRARTAAATASAQQQATSTTSTVIGLGHYPIMPRPAWWPPMCEQCRGLGFVPGANGAGKGRVGRTRIASAGASAGAAYVPCPACLDHPGHACSHAEHQQRRSA